MFNKGNCSWKVISSEKTIEKAISIVVNDHKWIDDSAKIKIVKEL